MEIVVPEAIVLRALDFNEADTIITYLTPQTGRLVGLARNARKSRKRFGHCLEPCTRVALTYKTGRNLLWLERSRLLEPHLALREDVTRWTHAAVIAEILAEMTPEGEPQDDLYVLVRAALEQLATDPEPRNAFLLFLLRFMATMGYGPALERCQVCGAGLDAVARWIWLPARGRLCCAGHGDGGPERLELDLGTLKLCRQAVLLPLAKIWRLRIRRRMQGPMRSALLRWVLAQVHKPLKSVSVLSQYESPLEAPSALAGCPG